MFNRQSIIILGAIIALFFSQFSLAFDDGDFQYWNTETVSKKINEDWAVALSEEFRFGDDGTNPLLQSYGYRY